MGWFWADTIPATAPPSMPKKPPHHPNMMSGGVEIPPECPMHRPKPAVEAAPPPPAPATSNVLSTSQSFDLGPSSSPTAPDSHTEPTSSRPWSSYLNPLNMMPTLSNTASENQKTILPTSRVISSIPKGYHTSEGNWEYPSPQQMYNAMLRKGYDDTPEDAVESMVEVHNFLNEGAWSEIVGWEKQFAGGVVRGMRIAGTGGDVEWYQTRRAEAEYRQGREEKEITAEPRLLRFQGRPSEPSPKARMLNALGWVWPSRFGGELPFDRHDWYVLRSASENGGEGSQTEVRYVIDYYSGPPEPTGEPVFYLDVRPALDRPGALFERGIRWGGSIWWKASGGEVRKEEERKRLIELEHTKENKIW